MWNYEIDEAWALDNCKPSEECCACKAYPKCLKYQNKRAVYEQRNKVRTFDVRNAEAFIAKTCDILESGASKDKKLIALYDLMTMWYEYYGRDGYDRPADN